MKRTLYISAVISLLALSASHISYAQDFLGPIQAKIDILKQKQDDAQTKYLAQKQEMNAQVASSTPEKNQEIKSDIEKKIGKPLDSDRMKIAQGFENALKNLNDLIQRISSRMTKMQTAGADISSSSDLFDATNVQITFATNNVTDLENTLAQPTSTSTRKAILARIKTQNDKTKSSVETAYRSIMDLIDSLKQESMKMESSASSTTDTASSSEE